MAAELKNEKDLLLRIADGDENAFAELFHFYTSRLHLHIAHLMRSTSVSEEIIQETFLRVWLNRDQLPDIEYPRAWIFSIASNICFNHLRQQIRQEKHLRALAGNAADSHDELPVLTELKEIRVAIHDAVDHLSGQRRLIWQLYRDQGLKQSEIASQLNISVSTVKNTIAQSLEFIRKHMRDKGFWIPVCLLEAIMKISS
ncbi:MAG: sigma-70 family RNA polymerase sigma factor [Chitinophagaceae bacterium]|nr:sigma-70 family RNA polymerase sigma factor [Chitinophagaceae bacterium]